MNDQFSRISRQANSLMAAMPRTAVQTLQGSWNVALSNWTVCHNFQWPSGRGLCRPHLWSTTRMRMWGHLKIPDSWVTCSSKMSIIWEKHDFDGGSAQLRRVLYLQSFSWGAQQTTGEVLYVLASCRPTAVSPRHGENLVTCRGKTQSLFCGSVLLGWSLGWSQHQENQLVVWKPF